MSLPQSVAEILDEHVVLELESIDRMYLNLYVPKLMYPKGVVGYLRYHLGYPIASSTMLKPITDRFVASIQRFSTQEQVPIVPFAKGQRKDDVMLAVRGPQRLRAAEDPRPRLHTGSGRGALPSRAQ